MQFGTISVSDGISMGHEGMRTFRWSAARSSRTPSKTVMQAGRLDGMVTFAGCDKVFPAYHGRRAIDVASVFVYAGSILPGRVGDKRVTIIDAFRAVGACSRGLITRAGSTDRTRDLSGEGACGVCTPRTRWPARPKQWNVAARICRATRG